MIKLVIFDMDGLMLDTERLWLEMASEEAAERGYEISEERYKETIAMDLEAEIAFWTPCCSGRENARIFLSACRKRLNQYVREHGVPVKPGLQELLAYLEENRIERAVASASPLSVIREYLTSAGVYQYFTTIVSGEECQRGKPDPEIFLRACDRAGISKDNTIILEDSLNGITAACRADIRCIGIPDLVDLGAVKENEGVMIRENLIQVKEVVIAS